MIDCLAHMAFMELEEGGPCPCNRPMTDDEAVVVAWMSMGAALGLEVAARKTADVDLPPGATWASAG